MIVTIRSPIVRANSKFRSNNVYIEHLRIPVGAGSLHVERVGRGGPPVVLLHGFGTCAFLWRAVAPRLANAGFTVLSFDLMGYGESDRPDEAGYGILSQAEYLDRALTALRLPKAVIVGQDIGALVGVQLAARRPERVERLLLVSPAEPYDLPGASVRALQRAAARISLGAHGMLAASQVLGPLLRESSANPDRITDLLVARYTAPYVGEDGLPHLLELARSLEFEEDEDLQVGDVRAPVLIALGKLDIAGKDEPIRSMASDLASAGTSVREEIIAGSGAYPAEDQPQALTDLILEWINVSESERVEAVSQTGELSPES
ncbi:MAG: alpha/beta hydrolase [Gemmatimonadaceae bacterium]